MEWGRERSNLSCSVVLGLFCDVLLLFVLGFLISTPPFSILILLRLWLDEKTPAFLFSSSAKVVFGTNCKQKHPVKLIFSAKTEISGKKISRAEEKNTPQKVVFAPKAAEMDEKGWFWMGNHREGKSEKTDFTADFATI